MPRKGFTRTVVLLSSVFFLVTNVLNAQPYVLNTRLFKHYIDSFNINDEELYKGAIPNAEAWKFLETNIPFLDCPDKVLEETYYFRWWTYRKHIRNTPEGYIITEFLPEVPWAGKYNGISCAAGFHFSEGRWLHDRKYLDQYAVYWFGGSGSPRTYSFWSAHAIYNYCLVSNDFTLAKKLLPQLITNYTAWEKSNLDSTGLFFQDDGKDGMEVSVCGAEQESGYRVTINSYMFGDALAIAKLANRTNQFKLEKEFIQKANSIKKNVQLSLWDPDAGFYKVLPRTSHRKLCSARELHGYTPWMFNMADPGNNIAWKYLMDSTFFYAPYGLTTVERNHPGFRLSYEGHECQWNGPSWPYATSITLNALSNLLAGSDRKFANESDYYRLLREYAQSHRMKLENGQTVPWIDENLNPITGDWISRTRLKTWDNGEWSTEKGGRERGKDYNHSLFCDLVISGLLGLKPQPDKSLMIEPLLPPGTWDYFCLDNVLYHGKILTILYDRTGNRYKKGKGFYVFVNGKLVASSQQPGKLKVLVGS
jgi:hypothetical protein